MNFTYRYVWVQVRKETGGGLQHPSVQLSLKTNTQLFKIYVYKIYRNCIH